MKCEKPESYSLLATSAWVKRHPPRPQFSSGGARETGAGTETGTDLVIAYVTGTMRCRYHRTPLHAFLRRRRCPKGKVTVGKGVAGEVGEGAPMADHGHLSFAGCANSQVTKLQTARSEGVRCRLLLGNGRQAGADLRPLW